MDAKEVSTLSKEEVKCEICKTSQVKANSFCRQCEKVVCEKCVEYLFCVACNRLICRGCLEKDHKGHNWVVTHMEAAKRRKEILAIIKPLRQVAVHQSRAVEEIETVKLELEAQLKSVAKTIETSHQKLVMIVEGRKQQLLEEASRKVSGKMENLQGQQMNISTNVAEIQSIVDNTELNILLFSAEEVLRKHAEIGSQIKQTIEKEQKLHDRTEWSIKPVEEVDIGVEVWCAEALEHLCQTKAKITRLPVALVVKKLGNDNDAQVKYMSEVSLYTTQQCNNKPTKRAVQIDCHLNSLYNGSLVECNVQVIGADQYCIQYTPTVRGRHQLTVSVDGQQVAHSPFPVIVSISPTQLDKPVKVWDGFKCPNGITVNSVGEIIVVESEGNVVVLDQEGNRLRSINLSNHRYHYLRNVAVDCDDNIYFTDLVSNRIYKYDNNCNKVTVRKVRQEKGPGHLGVAVVGDEVMVTERNNEGMIMVYSRELEYVRQIISVRRATLCCLTADSHQNLYVSSIDSGALQLFSIDGTFLHFIASRRIEERLKTPHGVCVAGQYLYVEDFDKIVVFTTEGDYVTAFGGPNGMLCVDQDRFVYACDYNGDKINIY